MELGERFGSLVVLKIIGGAKNVHNTALCLCDCGKQCNHRLTRLRRGIATQCKACGSRKTWSTRARANSSDMAKNRFFNMYLDGAKKRGLCFELSKSQCVDMFVGNCSYCGRAPYSIRKARNQNEGVELNGIDRIDSSVGYTAKNSVSCCSECNFAKGEMSRDAFISLARLIWLHQSK